MSALLLKSVMACRLHGRASTAQRQHTGSKVAQGLVGLAVKATALRLPAAAAAGDGAALLRMHLVRRIVCPPPTQLHAC